MLCPVHWKPRPSGLEYIPQVPGNRAEVSQNHDLHKTDSVTLTLKKKWAYISAQKLEGESSQRFALSVSSKARRSGVSLESRVLENIPQVPGYRSEVGQNHDARNAISAIVSVLK